MGYKYGSKAKLEKVTFKLNRYTPPTLDDSLNPQKMQKYFVLVSENDRTYFLFREPPHPGPEPLREDYSSDSAYNTAYATWLAKKTLRDDYEADLARWNALEAGYNEKTKAWDEGIHPILLGSKFTDSDEYGTLDGFLYIEYLGPQIDE
jgi:hypothetical protein